jgi:hypothetical protein
MPPKDKKVAPEGWNFNFVEGFYILIFAAAFLGALIPMVLNFLNSGSFSFYNSVFSVSKIWEFIKSILPLLRVLGFVAAVLAAYGAWNFNKKANAIVREEKSKLYPSDAEICTAVSEPAPNPMQKRWQKILQLSESQNSSDWRLCIIEADIILDELLSKLQLPGNTMGEKLKAVESSDFLSIDSAWEAHKARNNIAHQGNDFLLNQRETARIISLYESVFKEFKMI